MGGWSLFKPKATFNSALETINKEKKDLIEEAQKLDQSLVKVHSANQALKVISKHVDNMDYSRQKAIINTLDLEDEYKNQLAEQLDATKKQTQETLKPLIQDASKLQANMIVAKEKASQMILIVDTQRRLVESGKIQAESLKKLQSDGMKHTQEIKKLVADCESINSMARNTAIDIQTSKSSLDILEAADGNADWDTILADFEPSKAS